MKELEKERQDLKNYGFSSKLISQLGDLIDVDDYSRHTEARKALIKEGLNILPEIYMLLNSEYTIIRKEAMKIIKHFADNSSIDIAIKMLEDSGSEVRWIAAETLIRIGNDSIEPLLIALITGSKSYNLRVGAHHVLSKLEHKKASADMKALIHYLRHDVEIPSVIPVYAAKVLRERTKKQDKTNGSSTAASTSNQTTIIS